MEQTASPELKQFGPYRVIGMSCTDQRYSELWGGEAGFLARRSEIASPIGDGMLFGMSRCLPDGAQEYIAAITVTADCPVPEGMLEAVIGDSTYVVITVTGMDQIGPGWRAVHEWLRSTSEWRSYCDRDEDGECGCKNYPCFELYSTDEAQKDLIQIMVPVRPKA